MGLTTAAFNQAIKRNLDRFPADFSFILRKDEFAALISQFVTSKGRGGRRKLPRVFTEHGAIMAATILNSSRAVAMSVGACPEPSRMGRAGVCPDAAGDICQCRSSKASRGDREDTHRARRGAARSLSENPSAPAAAAGETKAPHRFPSRERAVSKRHEIEEFFERLATLSIAPV